MARVLGVHMQRGAVQGGLPLLGLQELLREVLRLPGRVCQRVRGLEFRVQGLGFGAMLPGRVRQRVRGSGFRVQGLGFGAMLPGCVCQRVRSLGFRVQGLGFGVPGCVRQRASGGRARRGLGMRCRGTGVPGGRCVHVGGALVAHALVTHALMTQALVAHAFMTHALMTHALVTHALMTHALMTHALVTHALMTHALMTHALMTHAHGSSPLMTENPGALNMFRVLGF